MNKKKILILDGQSTPIEEMTMEDIKSTSNLYKYYVGNKLLELGADVYCKYSGGQNEPCWDSYLKGLEKYLIKHGPFHAAISVKQRGYYVFGNEVGMRYYKLLKKYCKKVDTICDNANIIGFADTTYYATPFDTRRAKSREHRIFVTNKAKYVGWAADPKTCFPEKEDGVINVLIDHSYYSNKPHKDITEKIVLDAAKYLKHGKKKDKVVFRRFVSEIGIDTVKKEGNVVKMFNRKKGLNHFDACKAYRKADIFVVTHAESMGLSVIESAMAGALVLSPHKYIKPSLINPLHHLTFKEDCKSIPWDNAFSMIDHKKSRLMAKGYSWDKVSFKIAINLMK